MPRDTDAHLMVLSTKVELTRRETLKLLAGGIAALQTGCLEPPGDPVRPYARLPAALVPGHPRQFATSMVLDGFATGLVVTSYEGRPTKVDGNPAHPASLGGSSAQQQASVLDLYDPCRAQNVTHDGIPSSWSALRDRFTHLRAPLWLVLPPFSDPVAQAQVTKLLARDPDARVVTCGGPQLHHPYAGTELAFGERLELQLDFAQADVVLALDADPFGRGPMSVRWARDFANRRRGRGDAHRSYAVEPMLTCSGMLADHRLPLRAGDVLGFALAVVDALRARGRAVPPFTGEVRKEEAWGGAQQRAFVQAVADDLAQHAGRSLVVVGDRQPPICHAIAHALNAALGNFDHTVHTTRPVMASFGAQSATLAQLAEALRSGDVGTAVIVDCNPVHVAPPALALATRLRDAPLSLHVSRYRDETSAACSWHAPLSHYLESWGAARSLDGTLSVVQPLVRPLYDTRTMPELLALLAGVVEPRGHLLLRSQLRGADEAPAAFERRWNDALSQGLVRDSALPAAEHALLPSADWPGLARKEAARTSGDVELALSTSPTILDERFANNAWLQELPHPRTKQTWGNAALLAPALAERLGISDGVVLRIARGAEHIEVPAIVVAEHAPDSITLELGYGRTSGDERIARAVGANGYRLTRALDERILPVTVTRTDRTEALARTQRELSQDGREIAPALTRASLREHPDQLEHLRKHTESSLPDAPTKAPQWAMTIDTSACSGCSACVIACQSENNVPVVGKDEVRRGREMQWLRIDTYLAPVDGGTQVLVHQPMMCQHCEHAPCEYVCPVFATEHSPDGLNEMTYQRCIGTRFCQANCPYKVRRFNWLHYTLEDDARTLQRNPQVTVRDRGVMEKCTYCVQRIRHAEYQARMEHRAIRSGEVVTACQEACPTQAIRFGALDHADTPMVRERAEAHAYTVLHDLGTRPRTWYLAKLINANPALEPSS